VVVFALTREGRRTLAHDIALLRGDDGRVTRCVVFIGLADAGGEEGIEVAKIRGGNLGARLRGGKERMRR